MVVFFDIDGTLVDFKTQIIPESTIRAVKKLKENGIHTAVDTCGFVSREYLDRVVVNAQLL